jgi:hypothetical protein
MVDISNHVNPPFAGIVFFSHPNRTSSRELDSSPGISSIQAGPACISNTLTSFNFLKLSPGFYLPVSHKPLSLLLLLVFERLHNAPL